MPRDYDPFLFIAWAPYSRRSETFARAFQGQLHCIHYLRFQQPLLAPPKYLLQSLRTLQVLAKEKPRVIHVQNPPIFCGLVVSFWCWCTRSVFVFDHHSAAFAPVWRWALPLQKHLARSAVTNIVTGTHWAEIVHSWGADALIMGDPFLPLPQGEHRTLEPGFNLVYIGTYAPDEPLEQVIQAVSELPQVHLYITGDNKRKSQRFHDSLPGNVTCTGFLPDAEYVSLLRSADAIMVLTTRDHTLQLGGCEAISLGQPLITSDWPLLREFFPRATIHVDNSIHGIRAGIQRMIREHSQLKAESALLRSNKQMEWEHQSEQLEQSIIQAIKLKKHPRGAVQH